MLEPTKVCILSHLREVTRICSQP